MYEEFSTFCTKVASHNVCKNTFIPATIEGGASFNQTHTKNLQATRWSRVVVMIFQSSQLVDI